VSISEQAEKGGGTWRVEPEPGKGTRILVDVPLSPVQDAEFVECRSPSSEPARPTADEPTSWQWGDELLHGAEKGCAAPTPC